MIKAEWSPQILIMTKKTNVNKLNDKKVKLEDRITTFEGREQAVVTKSIHSTIVAADVENTVLNMIRHIQDVSEGNTVVKKLHVYFKLDNQGKLWLLHCSRVEVRDVEQRLKTAKNGLLSRPATPKMLFYRFPDASQMEKIIGRMKLNFGQAISKAKKSQTHCSKCLIEIDKLYTATFEQLLKWKNFDLEDSQLKQLLARLWGSVDELTLNSIRKKDKSWFKLTSKFCDICYLEITKS